MTLSPCAMQGSWHVLTNLPRYVQGTPEAGQVQAVLDSAPQEQQLQAADEDSASSDGALESARQGASEDSWPESAQTTLQGEEHASAAPDSPVASSELLGPSTPNTMVRLPVDVQDPCLLSA